MKKISIAELRDLSVAERIQLAEDLWDSVAAEGGAPPLTPAQEAELDRRLEEHTGDPSSAVPWAEVRRRLYERLG